jgi:hypothetical protein
MRAATATRAPLGAAACSPGQPEPPRRRWGIPVLAVVCAAQAGAGALPWRRPRAPASFVQHCIGPALVAASTGAYSQVLQRG